MLVNQSHHILLLSLIILFLSSCSGDPGTGPLEPKWDRDTCERCRMVLSDHNFAAQVRYLPEGKKRNKVVWFDDIGCAAIWLSDKPWKDDATTEIWVTDHRNGDWIDARKAFYLKDKLTPMAYGLGAQSDPVKDGMSYEQAKLHILKVELQQRKHSAHLRQLVLQRSKNSGSGE